MLFQIIVEIAFMWTKPNSVYIIHEIILHLICSIHSEVTSVNTEWNIKLIEYHLQYMFCVGYH